MTKYTYDFPMQIVTADMVVFREVAPYHTEVLLIKRGKEPFKGMHAFPGGHLDENETVYECAVRELHEETGLYVDVKDVTLLDVYSKPDRDPRGRYVSATFVVNLKKNAKADVLAMDDAAEVEWMDVLDASDLELAFDHMIALLNAMKWSAVKGFR